MIDISKYDYIVIGAGLTGSIVARKLAENNKKVLVVERRPYIGGNLYDYKNENGITVQKYGPHTFHTNSDEVINFVTRFSKFDEYHLRCEVNIDGIITPSPFNFKTIDQFYSNKQAFVLKEKLASQYPEGKATVLELLNSKDSDILQYAKFLFEKDYSLYTSKQWGISPDEVDPSVLKRVPVEFSYKDWYFYDEFEGIPHDGFTNFVKNILKHPNIVIVLNEDAFLHISFVKDKILYDDVEKEIVFTGELDKLFSYKYGKLPYRSLKFSLEEHDGEYQTSAIVAYPSHKYRFTRITEYTKLPYQKSDKTIIAKEYPVPYVDDNEPYYPILTKESQNQYLKYQEEAIKISNLYVAGRLGEFKYYNMDQAVLSAIRLSNIIINEKQR